MLEIYFFRDLVPDRRPVRDSFPKYFQFLSLIYCFPPPCAWRLLLGDAFDPLEPPLLSKNIVLLALFIAEASAPAPSLSMVPRSGAPYYRNAPGPRPYSGIVLRGS